jgi:hypothetical protein
MSFTRRASIRWIRSSRGRDRERKNRRTEEEEKKNQVRAGFEIVRTWGAAVLRPYTEFWPTQAGC